MAHPANNPHHLRRPAAESDGPDASGEHAAEGGVQRHHRPLRHRPQGWKHVVGGSHHDDARGVYELHHAAGVAQVLPFEERRDLPDEGQGEVRLHRHALRTRSCREDIRSWWRAHQDAGNRRAEVRSHDEEHREPLAARSKPQDDHDGLRREDQPERERSSGRQGEPEPELQHRGHDGLRLAEPEVEVRRQGRRDCEARGRRKRFVPLQLQSCQGCVEPLRTPHRPAVRQAAIAIGGLAEEVGNEECFEPRWCAADALRDRCCQLRGEPPLLPLAVLPRQIRRRNEDVAQPHDGCEDQPRGVVGDQQDGQYQQHAQHHRPDRPG